MIGQFAAFDQRPDNKLWLFYKKSGPFRLEKAYVFAYTWHEGRSGALAGFHVALDQVEGKEVEKPEECLIQAGSMVVFAPAKTGMPFRIVETTTPMSGEEARAMIKGDGELLNSIRKKMNGLKSSDASESSIDEEQREESVDSVCSNCGGLGYRHVGSDVWNECVVCNSDEHIPWVMDVIDQLKVDKDAVYEERNRLVSLFASMALVMGWKAGIGQHEDPAVGGTGPAVEWDPEWRTLVTVETPEGQASWHFHDSHRDLIEHLPAYDAKWDGHDTPTKYRRLEELSRSAPVLSIPKKKWIPCLGTSLCTCVVCLKGKELDLAQTEKKLAEAETIRRCLNTKNQCGSDTWMYGYTCPCAECQAWLRDRPVAGTLRQLQTSLPWTIRYSQDFRANPQTHKDMSHALLHVVKATGKLCALADDMDHDREVADDPTLRERYAKYAADLVVCALRIANEFPGGHIDLQEAVVNRIQTKNGLESL